ncbi:MAG: glycyl radical protein [Deltaproteobacteria bacterium]|nr:glycyl radical protein [Deltaproteobacteria bacterium]
MTPRTERLRSRLYRKPPEICLERALIYTESWKQTESQPVVIRRALATARILREMTIFIEDGELIVGNHASRPLAVPVFPEFSAAWLEEEMDTFASRPQDPFILRDKDRSSLKELVNYWKGKTHFDSVMANLEHILPADIAAAFDRDGLHVNQVFHIVISITDGDGHVALDFPQVLGLGFEALCEKANRIRESLDSTRAENVNKRIFLKAVSIVCKAAADFGRRYAAVARNMAETCSDQRRCEELMEIAEVCERVPARPAETFREALQAVWFAFLMAQIESNGHSMCLGRFDQYLYPFYEKDLACGRLTRKQAEELLECFWIKTAELNKLRNWRSTRFKTGYPMFQTLTLGGQTRDGLDAVNDLSYLCLEVTAELKLISPTVVARIHPGTPEPFLYACCRTNLAHGGGLPGLFNDSVAVPALLNIGVTLEDARDWAVLGCAEMVVPGKSCSMTGGGGYFSLLKLLEIALNNGVNPATGLCLCPGKGDLASFKSFEELEKAFRHQLTWYLKLLPMFAHAVALAYAEGTPTPLLSAMMTHRIEAGLDISAGRGPNYNNTQVQAHNTANLGNSLAAIKKLVFDEKLVSGWELKELLASNFTGARGEEVRQLLINRVPKYGNDDDETDMITRRAIAWFVEALKGFTPLKGGVFAPTLQTLTSNVPEGELIGATPDGRLAGQPTSDNVSPAAGTDRSGVTAAIKSVAKLEHEQHPNGTLFNLRVHPSVFEGTEGMGKFSALIRTFFDLGGMQLQFTLVSAETLREAQEDPERHPNLVVKVAGYSALFNMLDRTFQDQLIARTEHRW